MEYSAFSRSSAVASGGCGYAGDDSRVLPCSRGPKTPLLLSLSLNQQFVLMCLWLPALAGLQRQQCWEEMGRRQERGAAFRLWGWEGKFLLEFGGYWRRAPGGFTCKAGSGLGKKSGREMW